MMLSVDYASTCSTAAALVMGCQPDITYWGLISSYCVVINVGQQETPVSSTQQLLCACYECSLPALFSPED
jgi:hypothetical protein